MNRREFLKLAGAAFSGAVAGSAITDIKSNGLPGITSSVGVQKMAMGGVVNFPPRLVAAHPGELVYISRSDSTYYVRRSGQNVSIGKTRPITIINSMKCRKGEVDIGIVIIVLGFAVAFIAGMALILQQS